MPNYDRANREPDERAFDGGDDDDQNEGSHLPVVIIITILVLAAFGGVVWLAYNQGVARGRGDAPVRIASAQSVKTEEGGLKVYSQPAGTDEGDTPAKPAATQPQPAAQAPAPAPAAPVQAAPGQPAPVTPKPVTVLPPPVTPPPVQTAKPQTQVATATPPKSAPPAAPLVATKPPAQLGLAQPAPLPPKTAAATPAPAPLKPAVLKPADTAKPAAAGGSYLLQIGAYKSEDEARAAWKTYSSKHATLLAGFSPDVQRTSHDDGSIWYRLRIASFSDKVAAGALCDRLKAQGGSCFLAK